MKIVFTKGFLFFIMVLSLAFFSCNNGTNPNADASVWWDGLYTYGDDYVILNATNFLGSFRMNNVTTYIPNITTGTGGDAIYSAMLDVGDWLYVYSDGIPFAIVVNITIGNPGIYGGFNSGGVDYLINDLLTHGVTLTPPPSPIPDLGILGGAWMSTTKK